MKTIILQTTQLAIGYKQGKKILQICEHIDLKIHQGELLCLLGRNGSGKSTLLKTLANMIPALEGTLQINQNAYTDLSTKNFAKNIAVVLTESLPENSLTVYETIALGRQPYTNWLGTITTKDQEIVKNAMKLTSTHDLQSQYIHQLSDGQLQRVMIARALAQDTPIILLDEPTSHLDIHHKLNIFKILQKISKETQKTILISTHEINLALKTSDRLMLIHKNLITLGKVDEEIVQNKLKDIFNSQDIHYDAKTRQFIF